MDKFIGKIGRLDHPDALPYGSDLYEVLEISRNASAKEVREAYYRLKNTYDSSNQALYSLLDDEDLEDSLAEINQAYAILGHPSQKADYDRALRVRDEEQLDAGDYARSLPFSDKNNIKGEVSSERMLAPRDSHRENSASRGGRESFPNHTRIFEGAQSLPHRLERGLKTDKISDASVPFSQGGVSPNLSRQVARRAIAADASKQEIQDKISAVIGDGDIGDGGLFRRLRQLVGVSKEQMQDHIKISVGYIINLEENRFDQLPQSVYVKGFLKSYLRFLGVPKCERLVTAYAERFEDWTKNKSS